MVLLAFITQVIMVIFLYFATTIPPSSFWHIDNDQWNLIFTQSFGIALASWLSFLVTGYLDTLLFAQVKIWTKGKYLWVRSLLSDVPMLFLDSVLFVGLAFGIFGGEPWEVVWILMQGQILTKWLFGIIDTPFIYLDRWLIHTPLLSSLMKDDLHNKKVLTPVLNRIRANWLKDIMRWQ